MAKLDEKTWVLIADSEKALILVNDGNAQSPSLTLLEKEEQDNPPNREQAANQRGRVNQSAAHGQSAYSDTDWHELSKDRFAQDIADLLYDHAHRGRFDTIVLCTSRQVLGVLRDTLHQEVAKRIVAEIPKVLTNHPIDEIQKILQTELDGKSI
ncbi:host attachment protein [Ruegeria pomeroyi]|nr:host attachment protein [Ruegeria pomeroyi]